MKHLYALVGLAVALSLYASAASADSFSFENTPTVVENSYDFTNNVWGTSRTLENVRQTTSYLNNGFYWSNSDYASVSSNGLTSQDYYYISDSTFRSADDKVSLTVKGAANIIYGQDSYTTNGAAITSNYSTDAVSYKSYQLAKSTAVYAPAPSVGEPNTALVLFDAAGGWGIPEALDPYVAPALHFDSAVTIDSLDFANTTYTAAAVLHDTGFSSKFEAGDAFGVTITGLVNGSVGNSMTILLADYANPTNYSETGTLTYLDPNSGQNKTVDYSSLATGLLSGWATVDLSSLGEVTDLQFSAFTTDYSDSEYGTWYNTPLYFALDNLNLKDALEPPTPPIPPIVPPIPGGDDANKVPEPSSVALFATAVLGLGLFLKKRKQSRGKRSQA